MTFPRALSPRPSALLRALPSGLLAALLALVTLPGLRQAAAQGSEEANVRAAVDAIFTGMAEADSALVRAQFAPAARFAMKARDGSGVQAQTVDRWIAAIAGSEGRWNEQIYDVEVRVDADVAQVWAPYTFYLDGAVSHCGVNTIELLRVEERWLITQISDSRRQEGCPDPLATTGG